MHSQLPLAHSEQTFDEVTHQGKKICVGDAVTVHHAGEQRTVQVSSLVKKDNHFWVGYGDDQHYCPWPLVRLA